MQIKKKILAQGTALLIIRWYLQDDYFFNVDKTVDRSSSYLRLFEVSWAIKFTGKGVTLSAKGNMAGTWTLLMRQLFKAWRPMLKQQQIGKEDGNKNQDI